MNKNEKCPSEYSIKSTVGSNAHTQCAYDKNHEGSHSDGFHSWSTQQETCQCGQEGWHTVGFHDQLIEAGKEMRKWGIPIRHTSKTGAQKEIKSSQLGALDPRTLLALGEVAGFGAGKYARYNFMKGYDWSKSYDAAQRHLMQFWSGEDNDSESSLPHVLHAAWHCLAMHSFMLDHPDYDDRPDCWE